MKSTRIEDAHPELAKAAEAGPHTGWSTFDCKLEGARFHLMHGLVSAEAFDGIEADRLLDELEALSQSYGYGSADSYLTDAAGLSDEEIGENPFLSSQRENLFVEGGEEDQYFVEVRMSERLLMAAAATPEAKDFLGWAMHGEGWDGAYGPIHARMGAAFCAGRDRRAKQEFNAPRP